MSNAALNGCEGPQLGGQFVDDKGGGSAMSPLQITTPQVKEMRYFCSDDMSPITISHIA